MYLADLQNPVGHGIPGYAEKYVIPSDQRESRDLLHYRWMRRFLHAASPYTFPRGEGAPVGGGRGTAKSETKEEASADAKSVDYCPHSSSVTFGDSFLIDVRLPPAIGYFDSLRDAPPREKLLKERAANAARSYFYTWNRSHSW